MLSILEDMKKIIGTSGEDCKKLLLRFTIKCYEKSTNANITDNCISILIRAVCDKDLRKILERAPTLLGLERATRYLILRFGQARLGLDLTPPPPPETTA